MGWSPGCGGEWWEPRADPCGVQTGEGGSWEKAGALIQVSQVEGDGGLSQKGACRG